MRLPCVSPRACLCGHCCVTRHEIHHLGSSMSVWSKRESMVDKSLLGAIASHPFVFLHLTLCPNVVTRDIPYVTSHFEIIGHHAC